MITPRLREGLPYPLGATPVAGGVNFALFSANAEKIELCLFDPDGFSEIARVALPERTDEVRRGFAPGLGPQLRTRPGISESISMSVIPAQAGIQREPRPRRYESFPRCRA